MSEAKRAPTAYEVVSYPEPHPGRTGAILRSHPEIRELFGRNPLTAVITAGLIALQLGVAYAVSSQPWWVALLAAYAVGAIASNTLYVVIHEATHSLVFKGRAANLLTALAADLTHLIPSAMTFVRMHPIHHKYQGEFDKDADLPDEWEAKLVGNSAWRKALWLAFFPLVQSLRMARVSKQVPFWERWTVANLVLELAFSAALWLTMGPMALLYLLASTVFSVGLHPVGGRWIQEHFVLRHPQETYSYYGIGNLTGMQIGHHNEHHDFSAVPWNRLPKIRAAAPEFYDTLMWHPSWTKLVLRFIFDPSLSLYSRITRPPADERKRLAQAGKPAPTGEQAA
jgi:sphingolipid delta-4 desaturase